MSLVPWSRFYDEVMPYLPGCETPIVDNALRNAAIELCDFSGIHSVDLTPIVTVADQATYPLAYTTDATVAWIQSARTDSRQLDPKNKAERFDNGELWETRTGGEPLNYHQIDTNTLRLYPIPDGAYTIYVKGAIKPTRTATGLEQFVAEQYLEEIAAGALWKLCGMPKKPWSDPNKAAECRATFIEGKGDARIEAERAFTTASMHVSPRAFR